jgi:hypothetical protein
MERLIDLIAQVEKDDSIPECGFILFEHPIIHEIKSIADTLLITDRGGCNWANIEILIDNSIEVFPVELDRFGWILGGIRTTKGIITYG